MTGQESDHVLVGDYFVLNDSDRSYGIRAAFQCLPVRVVV